MINRFRHHYNTVIIQDLVESFNYKEVNQLPRIEKITLNCGLRHNNFNSKYIPPIMIALETLTCQRPTLTRSVKDNASLKVRSGMVTGAKVTLRKDKMYNFLERLVLTIIPRIKYFEGFPLKSVCQEGHFSVRLNPLDCLLLETEFEKFNDIGPIDVVITTQNSTFEETILMLTGFQIPFKGAKDLTF